MEILIKKNDELLSSGSLQVDDKPHGRRHDALDVGISRAKRLF